LLYFDENIHEENLTGHWPLNENTVVICSDRFHN